MIVPKSLVLSAASPDAPIMSQVVASQGQKQSDDGDGSWGFGWGREMGWITKGFSLDERERKEIFLKKKEKEKKVVEAKDQKRKKKRIKGKKKKRNKCLFCHNSIVVDILKDKEKNKYNCGRL